MRTNVLLIIPRDCIWSRLCFTETLVDSNSISVIDVFWDYLQELFLKKQFTRFLLSGDFKHNLMDTKIRPFDWFCLLITIVSLVFAVYTWMDNTNLSNQLSTQLTKSQSDINNNTNSKIEDLELAIFVTNNLNVTGDARNNYFQSEFGISYDAVNKQLII